MTTLFNFLHVSAVTTAIIRVMFNDLEELNTDY